MTNTYTVTNEKLPALFAALGKIARRAEKLGVEPVKFAVVDTKIVARYLPGTEGPDGKREVVHLAASVVEVTGGVPRLAGWTFCAIVDHTTEGNVLRHTPGTVDVPACYRTAAPNCEHCGIARRRNNTFVVVNEAGTFKQVGSSCLADFCGGQDPHGAAALATMLCDVREACEDAEDGEECGTRAERLRDTRAIVAIAVAHIRANGFLSRTAARDTNTPATADRVIAQCEGAKGALIVEVTDADRARADVALAWAKDTFGAADNLTDFDSNLLVVARNAYIGKRHVGIACYLPVALTRAEEKARIAANLATSVHVGTVGERLRGLTLSVIFGTSFDTQFGISYLTKFLDEAGNLFVWFGSSPVDGTAGPVTLTGTVKAHEVRDGIKQTVLTRCKIS